MSLDRSGLTAFLSRYREPVATGFAALALALFAARSWQFGDRLLAVFWVLGTLAAAALVRIGIQRARLPAPGEGPGIVEVTERRIAYLGPLGGGFVDLDGLSRVEIVAGGSSAVRWRFWPVFGLPLEVPADAAGADRLYEALTPLPGFDWDSALAAIAGGRGRIVAVWERQS